MKTEILRACKMTGAGNDFLFVNLFDQKTRSQLARLEKTFPRREIARRLCRRQESLGADGLIFVGKSKGFDFSWEFYNSDGSSAEMCGNAARCAVRFAKEVLDLRKATLRFSTLSGEVTGKSVSASRTRVFLSLPKLLHQGLKVAVGAKNWTGTFVDTGVPHFVTEAKFGKTSDLDRSAALALQNHPFFGEAQTNVTFIDVLKKNRVRAATFERGVRDFTKACGTGAVAAAFALAEETKTQDGIVVEMPGGELTVSFDNSGRACLEGEALFLGEVRVFKDGLYGG